jgi:hypothetical protein
VIDHERIASLGVLVEAFGHEHVSAQVHRAAPELRQELALDLQVLDASSPGIGNGGILIEGA